MTSRTRTAWLTAALATAGAFGLTGCAPQEVDSSHCKVSKQYAIGRQGGLLLTRHTTYDFKEGLVVSSVGYTSSAYMFNDIANPKTVADVEAAYKRLPASANCPAPVFAKTTPGI